MFYPVYVTDPSYARHSIEQACAQTNREVIRINFTVETDEDDLQVFCLPSKKQSSSKAYH